MIDRRFWLSAVALALLAGRADRASADVTIFSSFGPSPGYTQAGYLVGTQASDIGDVDSMGFSVSPGPNYTLSELELAAYWNSDMGGPDSFVVSLQADNAGTPGTTLESWTTSLPSSPGVITLTSTTPTTLVAGQAYWVTMGQSPSVSPAAGDWLLSSESSFLGETYFNSTGGVGFGGVADQSAFQILGDPVTAVPEPSTALPAGLGALLLIGLAVRARRTGTVA